MVLWWLWLNRKVIISTKISLFIFYFLLLIKQRINAYCEQAVLTSTEVYANLYIFSKIVSDKGEAEVRKVLNDCDRTKNVSTFS